jgi:hypothetical protein
MLDNTAGFENLMRDGAAAAYRSGAGEVMNSAQSDQPYTFLTLRGEEASVCLAEFSQVQRYRDFCRIEAVVNVTFRLQPSLPLQFASVLTSAAILPGASLGDMRKRLIRSAVNLALLLPNSAEVELRKTA